MQNYEWREAKKIILEKAIESFERNLATLRKYADIKTICMHGSPLSKWDSRLLWEKYDYRDFGVIGEPYLDMDFEQVAYYTDTGRRWDGEHVSVRDKAFAGSREKGKGKKEGAKRRQETGSGRPDAGDAAAVVQSPASGLRFSVFLSFILLLKLFGRLRKIGCRSGLCLRFIRSGGRTSLRHGRKNWCGRGRREG